MKNSDFILSFNNLPKDNILRDSVYTLKIPSEKFEITYDLIGLHKFTEEQLDSWKNLLLAKNPRSNYSLTFFSKLLIAIENSINNLKLTLDSNRGIQQIIAKTPKTVLLSNSPKTQFLEKLYSKHPEFIDGAFDNLINNIQNANFINQNYLKGIILAINFEMQDINPLSLSESEDISFSEIRNKFLGENNEAIDKFGEILNSTKELTSIEIQNLKTLKENWDDRFYEIYDEWTSKAEKEMKKSNVNAVKLLKKSLQSKIDLEQTYKEQLKFQVPAVYWKQRANELNSEGYKFMKWLIFLVILGTSLLFSILWLSPEDMLESIFSKEPVRAIRWSIIFITFISFLFFGIQALKKAMFSSFHLARDAEEREKLTVFYLSLIKDTTITQEDRSLILQSLFSRAETGMLKDDGNPTMPGIFDKIKA
ncbi:DUF6161 domain-containing protein [Flavobacterium aquiphilum]|uniref:DUF6161 domain-containing protein n=1 Tax=Flavobacterium aquiphilum TaxID=3003261 RepID=UPI00247FC2C1|nr:DUF6161 domain-containing protein [Flavobacterium aquiphilum]